MAATKIGTRPKKVGSVLKWEQAPEQGYSRDEVTVTVATGMDVGAVLHEVSDKWILVNAANVANASAVLIDDRIDTSTTGDQTLAILKRTGIVNRENLIYAADIDTTAEMQSVWDALEGRGILALEGFENVD